MACSMDSGGFLPANRRKVVVGRKDTDVIPWRARRVRFVGFALSLLLVLRLAPFAARAADSPVELEYRVKAGYLNNFAKFVEWPAGAFPSTNSPFVIGVVDGGEAASVIRSMFAGKQVNGRPVEVKEVSAEAIGKGLHIVLATRVAGKTPEELRKSAGSAPLLIVGETEEFAERGGTIGFVREGESVRLTLCLDHAAAGGLNVSSKLAAVAKLVKSRRTP